MAEPVHDLGRLAAAAEDAGVKPVELFDRTGRPVRFGPAEGATSDLGVRVSSVEHDSRRAGTGTLFACFTGETSDGHDHAAEAVAAGAPALLVSRRVGVEVPQILVEDTRRAVGPIAAAVHGHPSEDLTVIGVTGTNGKTTVTQILAQLLCSAGVSAAAIGTLSGARTTPEASELQRTLAEHRDRGTSVVAMEVSSHALDHFRVDGTRFALAVFTNLSPEHLDHHGTMEDYFAAKVRLFEPALSQRAVVNRDDLHGRLLVDAAVIPTMAYSLDDAAEIRVSSAGTRFVWERNAVEIALVGEFNVSNAIAAATTARELGLEPAEIAIALGRVEPVIGRFEPVRAGQPFSVIVD